MQVQLIITLALIAVTAIIALICDFLRARNAQLRQAMAQLEACKQAHMKASDEHKHSVTKFAAPTPEARPARPIQQLSPRQHRHLSLGIADCHRTNCLDRPAQHEV